MALADRLDTIAQKFYENWHTWREAAGWTLGPDSPEAKMSPFLLGSWDRIGPEGQAWFRQHAALVIHAIDQLDKPTSKRVVALTSGGVVDVGNADVSAKPAKKKVKKKRKKKKKVKKVAKKAKLNEATAWPPTPRPNPLRDR